MVFCIQNNIRKATKPTPGFQENFPSPPLGWSSSSPLFSPLCIFMYICIYLVSGGGDWWVDREVFWRKEISRVCKSELISMITPASLRYQDLIVCAFVTGNSSLEHFLRVYELKSIWIWVVGVSAGIEPGLMMMIALITINSGSVPLIEGLCAQILHFRSEMIGDLCSHLLLFFFGKKYMFKKEAVSARSHPTS